MKFTIFLLQPTVKQAQIETMSLILYNDCLSAYSELMQTNLKEVKSYFQETELKSLHQSAKEHAIDQVIFVP